MKVLLTGSSGTIGTRLCERLLAEGHQVFGGDLVKKDWRPEVRAVTRVMDMREANHFGIIPPENVEIVVHLAANARVYELVEEPRKALDNMTTLFNTLDWAREYKINKFIFASSREGYGNINADTFTEDMVRIENCESPYTASKVGGEALVHAYTRCYGVDHVIFRFSNVYGMYDESKRVVPLFIRRARANEPMTVFGKEKCLDFTYIDDTVDAILSAMKNFDAVKNDTYNLGYGQGTTLVQLAEDIKRLIGSTSEIKIGESRTGEVIRYVADISKARKKLGYDPKVPFSEGIKKAVEWYLKNT
ncbi:NAD-dependent epimerase/dehydratase family protein [Candidatus Peregrinibacteria bacterium]|nr:NAD-dependent epimerase/dehydratase family protein [Candidatus Peregrinibacteria bacterium]